MSYATFEDEEAQLPAAPKRTCSIRRVSVALVVTVGLVYAAAAGTRQATPLMHFPWTPLRPEDLSVCYFQDRWCYSDIGEANCQAAHGEWMSLISIYTGGAEHVAECD